MKKISVCLLSTILAICSFSPCIWARDNRAHEKPNATTEIGKCVQNKNLKGQSTSDADRKERYKVEIKKGASIAQRATELRRKNKGFAQAYADILKRGGKPVFEEAGISVITRDSQRSPLAKVSTNAAQHVSDGDYEMTFFPFDTGNDAVWEGTIYVRGPQGEGTFAISMSTTHQDASEAEIYYEDYFSSGGGGPEIDQAVVPGRGGSMKKVGFAAAGSEASPKAIALQRFRSWLDCVNRACFTAMIVCLFTGPFYFICFNSMCLGSFIDCMPPLDL